MQKNKRNVVSTYLESKVKVGVSLTPTGANRLTVIAEKLGISKSELFERIARGDLLKSSNGTELTFTLQHGSGSPKQVTSLKGETSDGENNEATKAVESPENSVTQSKELLESYEALQKQSQEQTATIASLQAQIAELQNHLETQTRDSVPLESHQTLEQQSQEQTATIASLQAQIAELQNHLETQTRDSVPLESHQTLEQ
ncbi:CopG family transcriptional regulator, partial [Kamptonema sp. UHCC 0994]|nr:CopG family transcriptional regulator [Kamptonema sp. UHCC 0994]